MKNPALLALALASFTLPPTLLAQGSLTPPGAPAPTMKALDQVEPRTIVNDTNTPGNASNVFRITAPGSYYLTGNVTGVSGKSAIEIASSHVTLGNRIDGNTLSRNAIGVEVVAGATGNTIIRNSALGNTSAAYSIVAGNDVGPIGPASTATNPFANISF